MKRIFFGRSRVSAFSALLLFLSTPLSGMQPLAVQNTTEQPLPEQSSQPIESEPRESSNTSSVTQETPPSNSSPETAHPLSSRRIRAFVVTGNTIVETQTILNHLPYKIGAIFDPSKSSSVIRTLYKLGYFRNITLKANLVGTDELDLHIIIEEKKKLESVTYEGNRNLSEKEILKKIDFSKIVAIDEPELKKYVQILKQLYVDKGYHFVVITPRLVEKNKNVQLVFDIQEGTHSVVRQILFKGNKAISSKKLRSILYTREDWILSILDSSGSYHPDAVEQGDKFAIETFYRNQGYLTAKVVKIDTVMDEATKDFYLTFHIEEGPLYTIKDVKVPGNELMSEEDLLRILPLKKGDLYSQARIQKSIELLRTIWGDRGYIYADVEPSIQPDEETKTVSIALYSELGSQVRLRRINIIGNKKSRDRIVRRQVILDEGDLLTTSKMDVSKNRVELLGFFDKRNGANWKINRIADDLADLDLILKEVKTGNFTFQVNTSGNPRELINFKGLTATFNLKDLNFYGLGVQYDINLSLAKNTQSGKVSLLYPWLFNRPITGMLDIFASNVAYEDVRSVSQEISERRIGGSGGLGFIIPWPADINVQTIFGFENLKFGQRPCASVADQTERTEFQGILDRRFRDGTYPWITAALAQDLRNHPMHASRGYRFVLTTKFGIPASSRYSYAKLDIDTAWYTPLIGEHDLILCLHAHAGIIEPLGTHLIPYSELYHIGGPSTVRGFTFGQISPRWQSLTNPDNHDAIGAKKAFFFNTELIFPVNPDFSIKAAVFYDGGAGWDTPDTDCIAPQRLKNNFFNYRHAVGVGVRLTNPAPIQIDWGFKLGRNRKLNEPASEVHITSNYAF